MGPLTNIFNDVADNDFSLAQDLVAMGMAGGNISDVEYQTIVEVCQSQGMPQDIVEAYINTSKQHA